MVNTPPQHYDPNLQSGAQAGAGAQYSATLTNNADTLNVTLGPGGTTVLVNVDVLIRDVGQSGVPGNQRGYDATINVSSEFPLLDPANYQSGFDFGPFFTKLASMGYTPTEAEKGEVKSEIEMDIDAQLAKEGIVLPLSQTAAQGAAPAAPSSQASQATIAPAAHAPLFNLKASTAYYTASTCTNLASTDPSTVLNALKAAIGPATDPPLTPDQLAALGVLASYIATQNGIIPTPSDVTLLQSWTPSIVASALSSLLTSANTGLTGPALDGVTTYLNTAADNICACNKAANQTPPLEATFNTLNTSTNTQAIYNALLSQVNLSQYPDSASTIKAELYVMAGRIANANTSGNVAGIESVNPKTIATVLTNLLALDSNTTIPLDVKQDIRSAIGGIATSLAAVNEQQWTTSCTSTNPAVVSAALTKLSNIQYTPELTSDEKFFGGDYLTLVAYALSFMSQVMAQAAELEGNFEMRLSQAELAESKDKVAIARTEYNAALIEITTQTAKIQSSQQTQKIMAIVMPVVTALVAVISILITALTMGAAAPVAAAVMCTMIALTTAAMVAIQVTDCINKLCDSLKMSDPNSISNPEDKQKAAAARAGVSFAIQATMMALMAVCSFGVGAIAAPAMGVVEAADVTAQTIGNASLVAMTIIMVASTLLTSGLLTDGIADFLQNVCGLSATNANYVALALSILAMIAIAAGGSAAGGAIAGKFATVATEEGEAGAQEAVEEGAEWVKGVVPEGGEELEVVAEEGESIGEAVSEEAVGEGEGPAQASKIQIGAHRQLEEEEEMVVEEEIGENKDLDLSAEKQHIEENNQVNQLLRSLIQKLRDPFFYTDLLNLLGQVVPAGIQIQASVTQMQLTQIQLDLTAIISRSQAALELISQLIPGFDSTIQSLQQDTTSMMKFMTSLLNTFEQMIQAASAMTTKLHQG